jgi:branched-subunit amino acid transport protein
VTSWIVILGAAGGSYALRLSMLALLGGRERQLPTWVDRCLTVVGPAATGAILGGMLLVDHGQASLTVHPQLIAAAVAFAAVRRSGRTSDALLVGFPVLWMTTALF